VTQMLETNYISRASTEYFRSILDTNCKFTAVEPRYLKKIHQTTYKRSIESILDLSESEREHMLDLLTDFAASMDYLGNTKKLMKDLNEKMEGIERIGGKLALLTKAFEEKLSPQQQLQILNDAVIKTNARLRTIYKYANIDFEEVDEANLEKIVITKQILYECIKLGIEAEKRIETGKRVGKEVAEGIFSIGILLLRLEAARRGKMPFTNLYNDLSIVSGLTTSRLTEEQIGSVYEVLGIEA